MVEPNPPSGDTNDYVLGRLEPAARHDFEAHLARDPELRKLVYELEEGALALAMAAPRHAVPHDAWIKIEAAVNHPAQTNLWLSFLHAKWLVNGWSVAGGLTGAFFIYLLCSGTFGPSPGQLALNPSGIKTYTIPKPSPVETAGNLLNTNSADSLTSRKKALTASARIARLQQRISGLQKRLLNLSQNLIRQEAIAAATNGLQSLPAHESGRHDLSPKMEQAILLAVTHQMNGTENEAASTEPAFARTSATPVNFVDLEGPSDQTALFDMVNAPAPDKSDNITAYSPDATGNVFAWDNNVVVTIDPATLPANTGFVTVIAVDANGKESVIGTVNLGNTLTIININNANVSEGFNYYVTYGGTNIISQFP